MEPPFDGADGAAQGRVRMRIGPVELRGLCRLAPLAGISNTPFRLVCKELGSEMTTSEEIRAKSILERRRGTAELCSFLPQEKPIAMQLFGSEPRVLAEAARILEAQGADIIDLNMGCPVWKIVRNGAGSALMREPWKAVEVFKAMRAAVKIPLTIKMRGGWDEKSVNAPLVARLAEEEGVDAVAVHPRTRSQLDSGVAPWDIIRQVVEAVRIPVTGNGDVRSYADALRMEAETGCKSVMIGRGAMGRPWVFSRGFEALEPEAAHAFKLKAIARHLDLIEAYVDPRFALIQMKKQLNLYSLALEGWPHRPAELFAHPDAASLRAWFFEAWLRLAPSLVPA